MGVIYSIFVLVVIIFYCGETKGQSWFDKIPSVQVKFKSDGISVSTGQSREEIYWMIGYIVGGLLLFFLIIFCIGLLICKFHFGRRSRNFIQIPMNARDFALPTHRFNSPNVYPAATPIQPPSSILRAGPAAEYLSWFQSLALE